MSRHSPPPPAEPGLAASPLRPRWQGTGGHHAISKPGTVGPVAVARRGPGRRARRRAQRGRLPPRPQARRLPLPSRRRRGRPLGRRRLRLGPGCAAGAAALRLRAAGPGGRRRRARRGLLSQLRRRAGRGRGAVTARRAGLRPAPGPRPRRQGLRIGPAAAGIVNSRQRRGPDGGV